jgi:hypothetical protein
MRCSTGESTSQSAPVTFGSVLWTASAVSVGTVILLLLSFWCYRRQKRRQSEGKELGAGLKDESESTALTTQFPIQNPPRDRYSILIAPSRKAKLARYHALREAAGEDTALTQSLQVSTLHTASYVETQTSEPQSILSPLHNMLSEQPMEAHQDPTDTTTAGLTGTSSLTNNWTGRAIFKSNSLDTQKTAPPAYFSPPPTPFGQRFQIQSRRPNDRQALPSSLRPGS